MGRLKDYKIAWFTEGGWQGKVSLDNPNMRNDVSTKYILGAEHYPIFQLPKVLEHFGESHFDFGIVTLPKTNTEKLLQFDMMGDLKKLCKKTISMQEGPHWYFQDYTMEQQIWWYNSLTEFDMLFAHNHKDVNYYKGITNKPVHKMPTLMLAERLGIQPRSEWSDVVIIGGNMVRWYGGFDSMIVAQQFDMPIVAPSMGRKIDREDELDIQHLSYMTWVEWINSLSQYHVGVHMMPTHAAGTFTLNCAFHGIPCIGYKGLDTQEELHPLLSVDDGDMDTAIKLANKLKDDKFYEECSLMCNENYKKSLYTENNFKPYIKKVLEELING
jgi:hypothetical protein|tara:strand:+ start:630 stop:1613 length:984 start_codon:yes stop_codon:yes gene_type:complete